MPDPIKCIAMFVADFFERHTEKVEPLFKAEERDGLEKREAKRSELSLSEAKRSN